MTAEEERAQNEAIEKKAYDDMQQGAREVRDHYDAHNQQPEPSGQGTWGSNTDLRGRNPPTRTYYPPIVRTPYNDRVENTEENQESLSALKGALRKDAEGVTLEVGKPSRLYDNRVGNSIRGWWHDGVRDIQEGREYRRNTPAPANNRSTTIINNRMPSAPRRTPTGGLTLGMPRRVAPSRGRSRPVVVNVKQTTNVRQSQTQTQRAARTAAPQRAPSLIDSVFGGFGRMPAPTISRPRIGPGRQTTRQVSLLDRELGAFFPHGLPTNAKKRKKASLLYDDEFAFLRRRK